MNEGVIKYEIIDTARGIALAYAPEQIIGGNETYSLSHLSTDINNNEIKHFVLDTSKIKAINSSGIGSLISLLRNLSLKSINLYLLNPSSKLNEILDITHLNKVFKIIMNIDEITINNS